MKTSPGFRLLSVLGLGVLLSLAASAVMAQQTIGVNFVGRNGGNEVLTSGQTAGVLQQVNWNSPSAFDFNNNNPQPETSGVLNDSTGAATAVTFTENFTDAWTSGAGHNSADQTLMDGIIKVAGGVGQTPQTMVYNNVSPGLYNIYVYAAENGGGSYGNISAGGQTYYLTEPDGGTLAGGTSVTYSRATATTDAGSSNPLANYVEFTNVSPDINGKITLTVIHEGGSDGFGIAATQLVQAAANITWTGIGSNSWDFSSPNNWKNSGGAVTYSESPVGPIAAFDNTGANTNNIVITGAGVSPTVMNFTNTSLVPYAFSGGPIMGSGSVNITGGGSVTFNSANTYTGITTISSGSLTLGHSNAVQNSTVTVNANSGLLFASGLGTANLGGLAGSGTFAMTDAGSNPVNLVVGSNGATTSFSGSISGNGTFTKTGTGTLRLTGGSSLLTTQPINITGGTLSIHGTNAGVYEGVVVNGGGQSSANDFTDPIPHTATYLTTRMANNAIAQSTYPTGWPDNTTIGYSGFIVVPGSSSVTWEFASHFDDNVNLKIDGNTVINVGCCNQNTGNITLTPGVHALDVRFGQGGGGAGVTGGGVNGSGLGFEYDPTNSGHFIPFVDPGDGSFLRLSTDPTPSLPTNDSVLISSNSTLDISGSSTPVTVGSVSDAAGPTPTGHSITLGANTLIVGGDNSSPTFSGNITGTGGLTKVGGGAMTLTSVTSFTGAATINAGTLRITQANTLHGATATPNVNNGLVFAPGPTTYNLGGLAGVGNVAMADSSSNPISLVVGANNANTTYSGVLSGGGTFTKTGSGTLTLAGANIYAGPYYVTGGTLRVGGGGVAGMNEGLVFLGNGSGGNGNDTTDPIPRTNVRLDPRMGNINATNDNGGLTAFNNGQWPANTTVGYSGYINVTTATAGAWNFASSFDDTEYLTIDGTRVLSQGGCCGPSLGSAVLTAGKHSFELRFGQGGGGAGPTGNAPLNGSSRFGFGYEAPGASSYSDLADPGDGSFVTTAPVVGAAVPVTAQFVLSSGTTLDMSTGSQTIGSIVDAPSASGQTVNLGPSTVTTSTGNDNLNTTFSGGFTGAGNLNKIGSGVFTLAGVSNHTGATTVSTGTLRLVAGSGLGNTAISVTSTGTLQVRPAAGGTISSGPTSSLALANGSVFDMSGDGKTGTFQVGGTMAISGGAILDFDIGTDNSSNTVVDMLAALGAASDNGTATINITGFGGQNLSNGLYTLVSAGTGLNTGSFVLGTPTVTVNGNVYTLGLVGSATTEQLRVTAPALNGSWIQTGPTPPSYSWGDAGNWASGVIPGAVPASGDTATFGAATATSPQIVNLDTDRYIGVLTFNNSGGGTYSIQGNGNTLFLDGGGAGALVNNVTGSNMISAPVFLVDPTIINATGGTTLTFAGEIDGGALTINPAGSGTVVLNNVNNSFNGGLIIAGGVVQVPVVNNANTAGPLGSNDSFTLGAVGGQIGTLDYTGMVNNTSNLEIILAGGGGGAIQVDSASSTLNLTGNIITLAPGTATLAINGPGTVVLSGGANNFAGGLLLNGGTLQDNNAAPGTIGSGLVTFSSSNAATLDLNGNSPTVSQLVGASANGLITNSANALSTLTLNGSTTSTYSGAIDKGAQPNGDIGLVVTGGGTQILSGSNNTFSGGVAIQNGTLQLDNATWGATNAVTLGSGSTSGTLVLGGSNGTSNVTVASLHTSGTGSTNRVLGGASAVSTLTITDPTPVSYTSTIFGGSGANQNNLAIKYTGGNTLTLSATNTYNGGTTVNNNGTLVIPSLLAGTNPVGSGAITLGGATLLLQGQLNAGLVGQFYNNGPANTNNQNPNFATMAAFTSHFASLVPTVTTNLATAGKTNLDYSNNGYNGNAPFNQTGPTTANYGFNNNGNYETVFSGYINITNAGNYTFATTSDDGSVMYIDGGDGLTPNDGGTAVNNNNFQGATRVTTPNPLSLSAGLHAITIGFYQGGGGQGLLVDYSGPDTGGATTTIPMTVLAPTNAGPYLVTQSYSNGLTVTSDSTVNITNSLNATVGSFSIGANTLNVTSTDATTSPFSLQTGITTLNGNATINVTSSTGGGSGTVRLGSVNDNSNNYSLTKTGPGTLVLTAAGTYGGGTNVSVGTVVATKPLSLGTGPVSLSNSTTLRVVANPAANLNGFNGGSGWTVNGNVGTPAFSGNVLTLTDSNGNEARSVFFGTTQTVQNGNTGFTASFTYQMPAGSNPPADGAAFILQNDPAGLTALGQGGGGLGYVNIQNSAAFEMNIYNGHTIGTAFVPGTNANNQTLASSTSGTYSATGSVLFNSGDPINVSITYNPTAQTVTETDTDANTSATFSTTYTGVNLASALGANSATLGFSGGTGGSNATQTITNFAYSIGSAGSVYSNDVNLAGGASATIDIAPTANFSTVSMGALNVGASGGTSTLNVSASTATTNAAYGLTLGATSLSSNLAINVANSAMGGTGTLTLGSVSGSGFGITANGPGVVVLSDANNAYTGNTSVTGGTLRLSNNTTNNNIAFSPHVTVGSGATLDVTGLTGSTLILASGQTLGGAGTVHGNLTGASGSTVAAASGSVLTVDGSTGLTLNDGSFISFALGTPNGTASVNPLVNISTGSLTLNTTSTLQLTGSLQSGTYDLISFLNGTGPTTGFTLSNLTGNSSFTLNLSYLTNEIDLIVSNPGVTAEWNVNSDGDYNNAANWFSTQGPGFPNGNGQTATFGNGHSVSIAPNPSSINVNVNGAFTVGSLVFSNTHGTQYNLGNDGVNGDGITLNNGGMGIGATITSSATAGANILANLTLADSLGTTISVTGGLLDISGTISGASGTNGLVKTGAGALQIDNPSSYTGPTSVNQGTLRTTATGTIGSGALQVNSSAAGLTLADFGANQSVSSLSGTVSAGSARVQVEPLATLTVNQAGTTSSAAGLTLVADAATGGALTKSGAGHLTITGPTSINNHASVTVSNDVNNTNTLTLAPSSATVGANVTATIGVGATLELAGSASALGTATVADRAHVIDNGTLTASTAGQIVGGIDGGDSSTPGAGSVAVADGASLQVDHVILGGSLSIGNGSTFTIDASDVNGNAMASSFASLADTGSSSGSAASIRLANLLASRSFASGLSSSSLVSGSASSVGSGASLGGASLGSGVAAVPEPSTLALLILGGACGLGVAIRRRKHG